MRPVCRHVYRAIVRLHPTEFRNQFAREMSLDFEDALRFYGPAHLFRDALVSLARQWSTSILSSPPGPIPTTRPSLLAGNYIMVRDEPFSPLELARGLTASAALLALCALGINAGPVHAGVSNIVYAASAAPNPNPKPTTATQSQKAYGGILHQSAAPPSFEVASIRPSAPGAENRFSGISFHPDRIEVRGFTIKDVIEFAYAVPNENQFSGGPSWIRTDKFDITAKPDQAEVLVLSKLPPKDVNTPMRLMLQSLLQERFHLEVSFPAKDLPFFALGVVKGGFKCTTAAPYGADEPTPPPPPPPPGLIPGHELQSEQPSHWTVHRMPFTGIVDWIARQPELGGRIVVDKTGLNGVYDCDVTWAREGTNVPGPSFFTAIEEQMGLKLKPERGPVETIVIDHIERPSPN